MNVKRALFILLMLVLPWQTRWFSDAGLLAGYPWEQGRISIYAFWLILLVCATVSLWQKRVQWRKPQVIELILLVAVLVPALFSGEPRASIAWLISVAFAGVFVWVLQREQIRLTDLALWFSISLIPHALLGMFQFAVQFGFDQKWLGLSALDPATKGTAVILNEGVRYLRAYGGFPHPNIFGGYLALALLGMAYFWSTFSDWVRRFSVYHLPLLAMALALTASRSAWLVFVFGSIALFVTPSKRSAVEGSRRLWLAIFLPFVLTLAIFPFLVRPVSAPNQGAAEAQSVNERVVALQQVPSVFARHPFFGTGQGALVPVLITAGQKPLLPHVVPVMALLELGLVGFASLLIALGRFRWDWRRVSIVSVVIWPLLLLDHYLWSYWSGHILLAIILLFIGLERRQEIR